MSPSPALDQREDVRDLGHFPADEIAQLSVCHLRDQASLPGPCVVKGHKLSVRRAADIELDIVGLRRQGVSIARPGAEFRVRALTVVRGYLHRVSGHAATWPPSAGPPGSAAGRVARPAAPPSGAPTGAGRGPTGRPRPG